MRSISLDKLKNSDKQCSVGEVKGILDSVSEEFRIGVKRIFQRCRNCEKRGIGDDGDENRFVFFRRLLLFCFVFFVWKLEIRRRTRL